MSRGTAGVNVVFFASQPAFEQWLEDNHDKGTELLVGFYKRSSHRPSVTHREALDSALCFGWIDGVRKKVDEDRYTVRFSRRRTGSRWSAVNMRRAEELARAGRVRPAGLEAMERGRAVQSSDAPFSQLDEPYERRFQKNDRAWEFFQTQPAGYRRVFSRWVMSAKREETRLKRLDILIDYSEDGERMPLMTPPSPRHRTTAG